MNKIKQLIIGAVVVAGIGAAFVPASVGAVGTADAFKACSGVSNSTVCSTKNNNDFNKIVGIVVNTLLYLLGAVCVIVIIIAGIMYTTSGGDSGSVTKAKNMLLYAVIGLVVAFVAFALVNWIFNVFK